MVVDLAVVAGYLLIMLTVGWRSRRQSGDSYWVAERQYGAGRITASLIVTVFGATATIHNHGGDSGTGSYGTEYGTHVIVQTGSTQNHDPAAWATYGDGTHHELVEGHGVGNFSDTMQLVDAVTGASIVGGGNDDAMQIAELTYENTVITSFGEASYSELLYEFWLPGYTGDFQVDWDQTVHGTIDTVRVDSMIAMAGGGGDTPFALTPVPEPATIGLLLSGMAALVGVSAVRRRLGR